MRQLENNQPCDLVCDSHPLQRVIGYSDDTVRYYCQKCEQPGPEEKLIPITQTTINEASTKLYKMLDIKKQALEHKM